MQTDRTTKPLLFLILVTMTGALLIVPDALMATPPSRNPPEQREFTVRYLLFSVEPASPARTPDHLQGSLVEALTKQPMPLVTDPESFLEKLRSRVPGYTFRAHLAGKVPTQNNGRARIKVGPSMGDPLQAACEYNLAIRDLTEDQVELRYKGNGEYNVPHFLKERFQRFRLRRVPFETSGSGTWTLGRTALHPPHRLGGDTHEPRFISLYLAISVH